DPHATTIGRDVRRAGTPARVSGGSVRASSRPTGAEKTLERFGKLFRGRGRIGYRPCRQTGGDDSSDHSAVPRGGEVCSSSRVVRRQLCSPAGDAVSRRLILRCRTTFG